MAQVLFKKRNTSLFPTPLIYRLLDEFRLIQDAIIFSENSLDVRKITFLFKIYFLSLAKIR